MQEPKQSPRPTTLLGLAAVAATCLVGLAAPSAAQAQGAAYPSKPITMVIPFPAGGATDVLGRLVAARLATALGQTINVENRTGAGGTLGADVVAKAAPDGHTILMTTSSTHSIGPAINPKMPYNAFKDFAPVAQVATAANVLVVAANNPAKDVQSFVAAVKASPGKFNFGSSGIGAIPHLSAELFKARAGNLYAVHIPYRGTQQVIPDLIAGQIDFLMDSLVTAAPHVRDGKLRALAVTGSQRSSALPNVPTFDEAGIKGMDAATWFGLFVPAGTDTAIVAKLNQAAQQAVRAADVGTQLTRLGADPVTGTPEQFAQRVRGDYEQWRATIQRAGITLNP